MCLASGTSLFIIQLVSKHSCTPLSLVLLFQGSDGLVETFSVFVTEGTKIVREEIQMGVQEMYLEGHITPQYLGKTVTVHPQFHGIWGFYDFLKFFRNPFKLLRI